LLSKNNFTIKRESTQNAKTKNIVPTYLATCSCPKLNDSRNENNQCDSGAMAFPFTTASLQAIRTKKVSRKNPVKTTNVMNKAVFTILLFNDLVFFDKTITVHPKHPHKKNESVNDYGKRIGMIEFGPLTRIHI
jgi:hypothetical protein